MRLILTAVQCVALASFVAAFDPNFEPPRDPAVIPKIFSRSQDPNVRKYPLAIEAVMSVALKLQAIDDRNGKQQNFLVSPLAVAGALGQLMLGAEGKLRNQIAVLLTLNEEDLNKLINATPVVVQDRLGETGNVLTERPISPHNAWAYQGTDLTTRRFDTKRRNGVPTLELHRQLGGLILDLSNPLPESGKAMPLTNSSYLHTGSAFFVDRSIDINEPFVKAISDFYRSRVMPLDFRHNSTGAQKAVNDWGSEQTGGLIDHFLARPPPPDTAVIQAVAVHFRGVWQTPFIPEATGPGVFKTSANTQVPVNFMRGSFEEAFYSENKTLGIRLLALPYLQADSAMYVILPRDDNPNKFNISHLVSQLTSKDIANLVGKAKQRTVNVMFPKLSLSSSLNLASALAEHAAYLNKRNAEQANNRANSTSRFSGTNTGGDPNTRVTAEQTQMPYPQQPQNASGIAPAPGSSVILNGPNQDIPTVSRNIHAAPESRVNGDSQSTLPKSTLIINGASPNSRFYVSDIIQQIALEVNESGTEAAAIAGSTVNYSGDVKNFFVNRPFLFFIRHEDTGAILFWGTIVDPTGSADE